MKYPSFQFYPGDHLKDPCLSMCSAATRGIWFDFLCAMHELDRSGRVTGTLDQLARIGRCTVVEVRSSLDELKLTRTAEITERNGIVTVINRRMQREEKERVKTRERVNKHRSNDSVTDLKRECNIPSSSSSSSSSSDKNNKTSNEVLLAPALASPSPVPPRASPVEKPQKKPKPPPDPRLQHWAIQTIRGLTNLYPKKILWDEIIATLGDEPKVDKLTECFKAWAKVSGNVSNSTWYLEWFVNGVPPPRNGNGSGEDWEREKARRIREEAEKEVSANGRNGWKF